MQVKSNSEGYKAQVVLASSNHESGDQLLTLLLRYPRIIHSENMTHRNFSTNSASSRAKPVVKFLDEIRNDPAMPFRFGANQPGMQDKGGEHHEKIRIPEKLVSVWETYTHGQTVAMGGDPVGGMFYLADARTFWRFMAWLAALGSEAYHEAGYHKQVANRVTEPYQWMQVQRTGNLGWWHAWLQLRHHEAADPTIAELARLVDELLSDGVRYTPILPGEWHLPWILEGEKDLPIAEKLVLSTARSARVSITPFDGDPQYEAEKRRHDLLFNSDPMHASPFEHAAQAMHLNDMGTNAGRYYNFEGFMSYRFAVDYKMALTERKL